MRCPSHPERTAANCCTVCGAWYCPECAPSHPSLGAPACPGCRPALAHYKQTATDGRASSLSRAVVACLLAAVLATGVMLLNRPDPTGDADTLAANLGIAYRNLELAGTALERYHHEHGAYPDSLDELIPKYLKELPQDPFEKNSRSLRYLVPMATGHRLLYSVGPDSEDQGGRPRDPLSGRGDLIYPVD